MRGQNACVFLVLLLSCLGFEAGCAQVETHADPQQPAPLLQFVAAWGVQGDGPGQLQEPISIATDAVGNIFITDAASRFVHKFGPQGSPLLSFQEDPLKHPQSITLDSGGAIYVTDPVRGSVFVFLPDGERYRELRLRTRPRAGNVLSVAVGFDGLIHVFDPNAGKIFVYTRRFRLLRSWQPPGNPSDWKTNPGRIAIGPDGYLYLSFPSDGRILKYTRDGHLISEIQADTNGSGEKLSSEFAVSLNYIFAMDSNGRLLHIWTLDGQPKGDVDLAPELGQAPRQAPALAVSSRGELLVIDTPGSRVLRYRINL